MANRDEKFLFNAHVFDKDGRDVLSDLRNAPPPPPVFSEQDMEAARKAAFAEGKAAAERTYMASHENRLASVLEIFAKNMPQLFAAEHLRERAYEHEAVNLSSHIFERLFPVYKETQGFEELKAAIQKTIQAHNGKSMIYLYANSEMVSGIKTLIESLNEKQPDLRITVSADDTLDVMACRMTWDHGGALRSTEAMAMEIQSLLQESLAAGAAKGHDRKRDDSPKTGHEPHGSGEAE